MMNETEKAVVGLAISVMNRELDEVHKNLGDLRPEGWANTPGGTDQDKNDARTAIEFMRWMMAKGIVYKMSNRGGWWTTGENEEAVPLPNEFDLLLRSMDNS